MATSKRFVIPLFFLIIFLAIGFLNIPSADAGTYDATVTTDSGSYTVSVEVEDGEVTAVHWPNGGDMTVSGAEISGGEASGYNSHGDKVDISIDDYDDNSGEGEE